MAQISFRRMFTVCAVLFALTLSQRCAKPVVDVRGPYEKVVNEHLAAAYAAYRNGDLDGALVSLDQASLQGRAYNRLDVGAVDQQPPISLIEVNMLRSFILFAKRDMQGLLEFKAALVDQSEPIPVATKLMLAYHVIWNGDFNEAYKSIKFVESDVSPSDPVAPLFYYARGFAGMFLARWDESAADFKKAVDLAPQFPQLYLESYRKDFDTAAALGAAHDQSITCLSICRKHAACTNGPMTCPDKCLERLDSYSYLRRSVLRALVLCAQQDCADQEECVRNAYNDVYFGIKETELEALDSVCSRLCDENIRCSLVETSQGICTDYCAKAFSPLGPAGLKALSRCFSAKQCPEARSCYQRIEEMKIFAEP